MRRRPLRGDPRRRTGKLPASTSEVIVRHLERFDHARPATASDRHSPTMTDPRGHAKGTTTTGNDEPDALRAPEGLRSGGSEWWVHHPCERWVTQRGSRKGFPVCGGGTSWLEHPRGSDLPASDEPAVLHQPHRAFNGSRGGEPHSPASRARIFEEASRRRPSALPTS